MNSRPDRPDPSGGASDYGGYPEAGYGHHPGALPGSPYGQQPVVGHPADQLYDPYQSAAFGSGYPGVGMQPYPGYQPVPPGGGPPPPRKEPALSLLLSFFLPGVGTIVNGETGKGITILALYFFSAMASMILIGIPFLIGTWVWGMVDAYNGARVHNARYGYY